ncbi:MAG: hypothetical protein ACXAC5_24190 [Promethearchaeota archaeon]|jgi:hypothetical protein
MKGIYLVVRGKLVHANDFYGVKTFQYSHTYLTGWLNVDFIDDDENEDLISTNRESLNWENEITAGLRKYLQRVLYFIDQDWREKRRKQRIKQVKDKIGLDIIEWVQNLPANERKLAKQTTDIILKSENIEPEKSAELVGYIVDSFEFGSFKEFAAKIEQFDEDKQEDFIKFFKEWEITEAKELYRLALVRIEAIKKFEYFIKSNAREVPTLHNFLKEFSWLLDPRIMNFKDEVTYSQLLREKFIETDEIEKDRRLDFLCVDFANTLFIIELKRPHHKVRSKDLDQALEYVSFIREYGGNHPEYSLEKIEAFIVCGGISDNYTVRLKADSFSNSGTVYVKTYSELQRKALSYHKEFIEKYQEITKSRYQ